MKDERIVQLENAMQDEVFVEKVAVCRNASELYAVLNSAHIDFTEDEVAEMYTVIFNQLNKDGEISEAALDSVSGGFVGGVLFVAGCYIAGRIYGKVSRDKAESMVRFPAIR